METDNKPDSSVSTQDTFQPAGEEYLCENVDVKEQLSVPFEQDHHLLTDKSSIHTNYEPLLSEVEQQASEVSAKIHQTLTQIQDTMNDFAGLTQSHLSVYQEGCSSLTGTIDQTIQSSVQLITKCDELDQHLQVIDQLQIKTKTISQNLTVLESLLK